MLQWNKFNSDSLEFLMFLKQISNNAFLIIFFCNIGMRSDGKDFIISIVVSIGYCLEVEDKGCRVTCITSNLNIQKWIFIHITRQSRPC